VSNQNSYVNIIKNKKEDILIGEIGALLHDIGKCHPDFIGKQSLENDPCSFEHADIDSFLDCNFIRLINNDKFKIKINNNETNIHSLITEHHDKQNKQNTNTFIKKIQTCDRKDSADDKGIVRRNQSKYNVIISSPFGFDKEIIDLKCLKKRLDDLINNLIFLFNIYTNEKISTICFRELLINNLKSTFSHALGETRIPSNDVTLWDHSYSTASLFKPILAGMTCGKYQNDSDIQWRIFGISWNGIEFINQGRKIADIKTRSKIIEEIKANLKGKFECEIPIGNVIYEDINGIYFTFPNLDSDSENLAIECSQIALEDIRKESDYELWPFFLLSDSTKTLTIITNLLNHASKKRTIPKMSPILFVEDVEEIVESPLNTDLNKLRSNAIDDISKDDASAKIDVCPVCGIRTKSSKKERCKVCEDRRMGRLNDWLICRQKTIWTTEVADKNNRVALLSFSFYLDNWLNGTMIGTIFSQTYNDWFCCNRSKNFFKNKQNINKLKNYKIDINDTLFNLSKNLLKIITDENITKDAGFKSNLINTFYEDIKSIQKPGDDNDVGNFIIDIKEKIAPREWNKENLAWHLFTQNPSPARLYRIWKETEGFFELVINEINNKIYKNKWKRITFPNNNQLSTLSLNTPYLIHFENLEPDNLLVLYSQNQNGEFYFYTIESLEKFKFKSNSDELFGAEGVQKALEEGFDKIAPEEDPKNNILGNNIKIKVDKKDINVEEYIPNIEINKSPLSLRIMVPASDSMKIIELITKLYNERFEKVLGKLPLNTKLLVANRKFPLYLLLDAESRMLENEDFTKTVQMKTWWNLDGLRNDEFYGYYPISDFEESNKKINLDDISQLSNGKIFYLYPGYFDFDLLSSNIDRYNINYRNGERANEDYRLFTARPYYQYEISKMLELWDILSSNISSSQINIIEELFTSKKAEWKNVNDKDKNDVFRKFSEMVLKDSFGKKWDLLSEETKWFLLESSVNNLLLDTIILFKHILKEGVDKGE